MTLTFEAIYESGVLKPVQPLPLPEHEKVQVTVQTGPSVAEQTAGIMGCCDPQLIDWAAMDPELDFPAPREEP